MKFRLHPFIFILTFLLSASSAAGYQFTFTPRISLGQEYSDNLFLTKDNKKDDFIITVSPELSAGIVGKTKGAVISYNPEYVFYNEFNEFDGCRHNASFSAWNQIARNTRLELVDAFVYTEDPESEQEFISEFTEEPIIESDTTIRQNREIYYTNAASMRLTHQFGISDSIYLGYVYSILRNNDPDVEDNDRHMPSIGFTYWFLPDWGIDVSASYTKAQFSNSEEVSDNLCEWNGSARLSKRFTRHFEGFVQYTHTYVDYKGDTEDFQVYDSSMGINYATAQDMSLSLGIGYFLQDRKNSENEDGILIDSVLGKTWTFKKGSIYLAVSQDYDQTYGGAENLGFNQYYQAVSRGEYDFTRQLAGDISVSYRRNRYSDLEDERTDKIASAGLGLSYQPQRWVSLRLDYTYRTVDSTEIEYEYNENRVLLTVTLSPSTPVRMGQ